MKSEKDENDKSNCLIKKLKTNINKAISPQERFNSTYKQRPYTSMKIKKQDFDGKANFTKNNFYIPKLSKAFFASKNQTHNLYYNKHSLIAFENSFIASASVLFVYNTFTSFFFSHFNSN